MTEKGELLSQTYTLRAGLSWISQKKEEINKLKNAVTLPEGIPEKEVLSKPLEQVNHYKSELYRKKSERTDVNNLYNRKINWSWLGWFAAFIGSCGVSIGFAYWQYAKQFLLFGWIFSVIACAAPIAAIVFLVYSFKRAHTEKMRFPSLIISFAMFAAAGCAAYGGYSMLVQGEKFWTWVVFVLGGFALLMALFHFISSMVLFHRIKYFKRRIQQIADKEKELKESLQKAEEELQRVKDTDLVQVRKKNAAALAEAYRQIDDIRQNQINPLIKLCNEFYDTLVQTYGDTLDVRDWCYLDIVIYYIETNRAMSIREALQQVDRERQTQQIVTSMRMATEQICRSIKTEISSLRESISNGFNRLEQSFSSNMASLQASVESSAAQTRILASAQISQSSLTNALLAQSNSTSEQLMNDVHYFRERMS